MRTRPLAAPRWDGYWEGVEHRHIFAVEARDHVRRLRRAVPLTAGSRVLDFGCGFGHVAQLLAPLVSEVGVWDAAERMRRATADRTAGLPSVVPVDLSDPGARPGPFDLVLANSVVQYMDRGDLADWLVRWRGMLAPQGRIVLSDIPVPDASAATELVGMLRFAARNGFLLRAVRDGAAEALRYARSRGDAQLLTPTPDDVAALARPAGLAVRVLPDNLTHRAHRLTVELTATAGRPPERGNGDATRDESQETAAADRARRVPGGPASAPHPPSPVPKEKT